MLVRNHVAIVVVGLGIFVVAAYEFGTSDQVVKRVLAAELMKRVRAPCTFERATFTFLGGLELRGLVVLDPDDPFGPPLVAADVAKAEYTLGLFGAGPRITDLRIEGPRLSLGRRADGSLHIKDAFDLGGEGQAPPFTVSLRHGEATYADPALLVDGRLALKDVAVDVTPAPKAKDWTDATVTLRATSDVLGPLRVDAVVGREQATVSATLDLPAIRIDASVPRRFVGDLARRIADMAPAGAASANVRVLIAKNKSPEPEADLELHDASLRVTLLDDPPLPPIDVSELRGHFHFAGGRLDAKDVAFRALGAEFHAEAVLDRVQSDSPTIDAKATVAGLVLDDAIRGRLPQHYRRIVEAYDLRGTAGATAAVKGPLESPDVGVVATLAKGHVRYDGYVQQDGVRHGYAYDADEIAATVTLEGKTVRIEATGRHGPATVSARGTVTTAGQGAHDVPDLTIVAQNVPLDADVKNAFHDHGAKSFDPWKPSGVAQKITVHVWHDPAVDRRPEAEGGDHDAVDVTIDVDGRASFVPHVFPAALTNVTGRVEVLEAPIAGGRESLVRLTDVVGRGDGFDVRVSGEVRGDGANERQDLTIRADVAEFSGAFKDALLAPGSKVPEGGKTATRRLEPSGAMRIDARVVGLGDGKRADVVDIELRGAAVKGYDDVPLAARRITGRVHVEGDDLTLADIAGEAVMDDFAPQFRGHGALAGLSGVPQPTIHVEATDLPLGEPLRAALGPLAEKGRAFWEKVVPVGSVRADCILDLRPDADPTPFEITLSSLHGALRPLGLELDCDGGTFHYDTRKVEMRGVDAAMGAATMRFDSADYDVAAKTLDVRLSSVRSLRFPEDLEGLLTRATVEKIAEKAPSRLMHAPDLHVVYSEPSKTLAIDGNVVFRARTRKPTEETGYAPEGMLAVERLTFVMPDEGPVAFEGAARAEDFALKVGLEVDRFNGPLAFAGELGETPNFEIHSQGASFRVEDYPFEKATVDVTPTPLGERVVVSKAKFMNGDFVARVQPGDDGNGYQGRVGISGADLEKFLRSRGAAGPHIASGVVDVDLKFSNPTGAKADLRGDGRIAVKNGELTAAPGIGLVLLKVATLGLFDAELTDAEMKFDLRGDRLLVKGLDVGSAGSTGLTNGKGWIDLGGRLDVTLDLRVVDVNIIGVRWIVRLFQKAVVPRVHVTGTLRNPRQTTEWISLVGAADEARPEPPAKDDVRPADRDPW